MTKRSKKTFLTTLIVCLCVFAFSFALSLAAMANGDTFSLDGELNEQYVRNGYLSVPKGEFFLNGNRKLADASLIYPDGRITSYEKVRLDEEGTYTLIYTAEIAGQQLDKTYTFDVVSKMSSLFIADDSVEFTNNCDSPEYTDGHYNGVKVTVPKEGMSIRYDGILDLSDNTSSDTLFEYMYAPTENGVCDLMVLTVVLTDVYDPDNYVKIRVYSVDSGPYMDSVMAYAQAASETDYGFIGYNPGAAAGKRAGYNIITCAAGKVEFTSTSGIETTPFRSAILKFDFSGKAVWAAPSSIPNAVCDFDDPSLVGNGNEWKGFTTGEVYMDVVFDSKPMNVVNSNIIILNVDGRSLSGEDLQDFYAPRINLDLKGNSAEALPFALVGQKYDVFEPTVYDDVDGVIPYCDIDVYDESGVPVIINNGAFVPLTEGAYTIKYTAADKSGRVAIREEVVRAYAAYPQDFDYVFKTTEEEITVGLDYLVKDGFALGGSGVLDVERHLTLNGEEYEVADDYFKPVYEGDYVLSYKLTDYLGNTATFTHIMTATFSDAPIMDAFILPSSIISGETYSFPVVKAYDYKNDQEIYADLFINGKKVDGYDYKLSGAETITVKYVAFSATDDEFYSVSEDHRIKVKPLDSTNGTTFCSSYFDFTNVTGSAEKLGYRIETSSTSNKVSFIKAVPFESFSLLFDVVPEKNNFSSLVFTLTDSKNAEEKIRLKITKSGSSSIFSVNDGIESSISGSFFGTSTVPFKVILSGKDVYDYNKNFVDNIKKYLNGKEFTGFSSGLMFVDFEFAEVTGESAITLNMLSNQPFGETSRDTIEPIIVLGEEYSEYFVPINTEYTIHAANAYDVLDYTVVLSVEVRDPDNQTIYKGAIDKAKKVTLSKIGSYAIVYSAKGEKGVRTATKKIYVTVSDTIAPTVSLTGSMPTSLKKGDKLTVPAFSATDNITEQVYTMIYVMEPSGKIVIVDNEYKTWATGRHTLWVYASDDYGNVTIKDYIFYVE